MASLRFQYWLLTSVSSFNNHLTEWHVSKFKFSLVLCLFKTNIKDIYWSTKWPKSNFWRIRLESNSSHWIVVFNLLAANLIPLRSLGIVVIDIESIKVSNNGGLPCWVKGSLRELLDLVVFRVVHSLEAVSIFFIERDFTIISTSNDMDSPR